MTGQTVLVIDAETAKEIPAIHKKLDAIMELLAEKSTPAEVPWLTTKEFCEKFRTSPPTLRKMRAEGKVEVRWLGENSPRYRMKHETA